ncbi:MAG TPA: hypothetical protein DHU16_01245 [Gammaproteobacteria bacterium]|nr:hypothetical protein [Gammaproteobacteria bacterium]
MKISSILLLLFASSVALASGDKLPRTGILISATKDDGKVVRVDPNPLMLSLRRSAPSLNTRVRGSDWRSPGVIEKQVAAMAPGAVYLKIYGKDGMVQSVVPLREIRAYASHREKSSDLRAALATRSRFWADPRLNHDIGKVAVMRKTSVSDEFLGLVNLRSAQ